MADDQYRRSELAKIHIAREQLGLDDAVYREIIRRISGKFRGHSRSVESAADLDGRERHALLEEFKSKGFKPAPAREAARRILADSPQARKIRASWLDLKQVGALRDPSERALAAFVKHQTGIEAIQWLSPEQANSVIEGLKAWYARVKKSGSGADATRDGQSA